MTDNFSAAMRRQEVEDKREMNEEELFLAELKRQFAEGERLVAEARRQHFSLTEFRKSGAERLRLSFVPTRTEGRFRVKKHTSSQRSYLHGHDHYEFDCVLNGACRQTTPEGIVTIEKGSCLLLCPGDTHSIERPGEGDLMLKMYVPADLFAAAGGFEILGCSPDYKKFAINESAKMMLLRLLYEQNRHDDNRGRVITSWLTLFFTELQRGDKSADASLIADIENYIKANLKGASLADYAAVRGYSKAYLSRLIKSRTGMNFSDILNTCRLNVACDMLIRTDMSIEDITAEVGYCGISGFYKRFYAKFGVTPSEYRQAAGN